jgi:hypothetical protein
MHSADVTITQEVTSDGLSKDGDDKVPSAKFQTAVGRFMTAGDSKDKIRAMNFRTTCARQTIFSHKY